MATYSKEDFERIAAAIGKDVADVAQHETSFESAAHWYRQDCRAAKASSRVAPSDMSKRMTQIANAARKLLGHLEVCDPRQAPDGPGAIALLEFLTSADDGTEDDVIRATARVGRLVEIFDSIDAARELKRRARKAAPDAVRIGELIVPKGRHGQPAVNNWIAEMMPIYKKITGKDPRASVITAGPRRGKAAGPFIRFLEAASKPLEADGEPLCVSEIESATFGRMLAVKNRFDSPFCRYSTGFPSPDGNGRYSLKYQEHRQPGVSRAGWHRAPARTASRSRMG